MKNALHRLVYLSRNNISGDSATMHREITQILRAARVNNAEADITGALMFNSDLFAQVLEGPKDKVQKLFDHIESDERHLDMRILDFSPVERRCFSEWAMAYVGEEPALMDRFFMIAEETNFDPEHLTGDHVFDALLTSLKEQEASAPLTHAA